MDRIPNASGRGGSARGVLAAAALAALTALAGCTNGGLADLGDDQSRAAAGGGGSGTGGPDGAQQGAAGRTMPPDVMTLPSVPYPPGAEVLLGNTVIIGDDDSWTGQVVMATDRYSLVQVVEFMRTEMPNHGWQETAIVRSRRTSITYIRDDRFATLRIRPRGDGAEIDLVVAPLEKRGGG